MLPPLVLDRNSPVPLHFQVSQHLEQVITSGQIPPGTLFTSEIELGERLGVSRPTMRRAMQQLVDKGLVVRRRGIGTRVVRPKVKRPMELTSLFDDLKSGGQSPTTQVLALEEIDSDEALAAKLEVKPGEPVVRVVRLRSAAGRPIAKMTNYLPTGLVDFDAETLEEQGLYALLRARGVQMHMATQVVGARQATASESRLLDEPRGSALLTMERTTYDDHGTVVEYGSHVYAASRYTFETSLMRS
ncbi:GntR family transcriptional regulator [Nocardioides sp. BSK12Z-4]|uniref:GntR family transcriptional regulator n=1 Tax=Nocardioides bruguierae TaxID=2945102 RepID=A0A9X2D7V5_9ACTN|nr:GntR family transcriptional regulator [Nocardioides bruguierae]MCM0620898.1 GntR family transcriptional regulator [Nocardioides bruguierae]